MSKIKSIMDLVFKELKYRKSTFKVFIISAIAGIISLMAFTILNDGVVGYLKELINGNNEYKVITITCYSEEEKLNLIKFVKAMPHISGIYEYMQLNGADMLSIDGTEYMPMEEIKGINTSKDVFSETGTGFMNKDDIVCGSGLQKEDEKKAIIDEYALLSMGIKDYNDILGKKVVIRRGEKEVEVEIIGVYTIDISLDKENAGSQFYDDKNRLDIGISPIILTYDSAKQLKNTQDESVSYIQLTIDSVSNVEWIYEQLEKKEIPAFAEIKDINKVMENLDIVREILHIVANILLVIAIINMLSVLSGVIAENRKWYQILMIIGYRKEQIIGIVSIEMLLLAFEALIISGIITLILVILLNNVVSSSLGISAMFSYPIDTFVMLTFLFICCVVMANAVLMFFYFRKREMI